MRSVTIGTLAACLVSVSHADVGYKEEPAEFSSGFKRTLAVSTNKPGGAAVFLICQPDEGLEVQIYTDKTMFPDDAKGKGMQLSVTHRFDTDDAPEQSIWSMNIMRYHNAWYRGDPRQFAEGLMRANKLSVKLDKTGDVYRYALKGTAVPVKKVLEGCTE